MKSPTINFKLEDYPKGNVTQWFAENPALYAPFGLKYHNGIDLVAPHGSPIYSVSDGTVIKVKTDPSGNGKYIRIREKPVDGYALQWVYCHLDTQLVKEGQKVKAGQQIGTMGNTGFVVSGATPFWENNPYAGTHLHLGVKKMQGETVLNEDNGVKGAIDPTPFLQGLSTEEALIQKQLTLISILNTLLALLKKK